MKTQPHYTQIDYRKRETIAIGLQQGLSIRAIARKLGRAPSSISRELVRNQPGPHYSCHFAQQRRDRRRLQGRPTPKLAAASAQFDAVARLLRLRWSPRQIAAHLAKLHPPGCNDFGLNLRGAQKLFAGGLIAPHGIE